MNALWAALSTLTLIPFPTLEPNSNEMKNSVLFYPLVGGVFGGIFILLFHLSMATDLKALVILFVWIVLSGAFHLDGLGDCLDGFFGGKNVQDRQRIMKAADLGTYGLTGIAFVLIAKMMLLAHLLGEMSNPYWLLAIPVASRWALCLSCFLFRAPEGNEGLGSTVLGAHLSVFLIGSILAIAGCSPLQKEGLGIFAVAGGISIAVGLFSKERIGGLTGDGLGATVELTETALLFLACLHTSKFFL